MGEKQVREEDMIHQANKREAESIKPPSLGKYKVECITPLDQNRKKHIIEVGVCTEDEILLTDPITRTPFTKGDIVLRFFQDEVNTSDYELCTWDSFLFVNDNDVQFISM